MATTHTRMAQPSGSIEQPSPEAQRELADLLLERLKPEHGMCAWLQGDSEQGHVQVTTLWRPADAPTAPT